MRNVGWYWWVPLLACAAPAGAVGFGVGVVGGTNAAYFSGEAPPDGSFQTQTGFAAGAHFALEASPKVHIVVQPMITQRTPTLEIDISDRQHPDAVEVYEGHIDYVAVPVLAQYVFAPGKLSVFLGAGAEIAFRGDATLLSPDGTESDIQDVIAGEDISALLNIGLRFPVGPFFAQVETRHAIGLVDIADEDPLGEGQEGVVWKSRSSGLVFGLTYPLFGR